MKVIILGASGMLGHRLLGALAKRRWEVIGTVRGQAEGASEVVRVSGARIVGGVAVGEEAAIEGLIETERPDAVVNCIGVVKHLAAGKDPLVSIPVNSLFPHRLAELCERAGVRMIHFSTDCVFSGRVGPYSEADWPDPQDLYGRSKLLGEVGRPPALTLRTSVIGHELGEGAGLISWILRNKGQRVSGFARALYTGVTTDYMVDVVHRLLTEHPDLTGVWHFSADEISKFELVSLVSRVYGLGITIDRDETFVRDRRLDSTPFRTRTGIVPPSWDEMIEQMHAAWSASQ